MKKVSILEVYDIATGKRAVLQEFEGVIEAPNWLRNGDTIVYNANGLLWRYSIATGKTQPIPTGSLNKCNNDHVVSNDDQWIGFSCNPYEEDGWVSQVYMVPVSGGEPRQVTQISPSYLHGISPDGQELAYCAFRNKIIDIYTIPSSGGEERKLTDGQGYNDGPEYSPDGKHIWFNSTREGLMQAFRMERDGSHLSRMTHLDMNCWFPHVSPDGEKVVFLVFRKGDLEPWEHLPDKQVQLWRMNADGSDAHPIVDLFGGQGTINVNSWSADSKRFAFVSYRNEE